MRLCSQLPNRPFPKEDLQDVFEKYGEVTDVYITGKGFAFVTMMYP